ncbi:MAG: S10 family peptidase, partial [Bryobacteraceae bacterium]
MTYPRLAVACMAICSGAFAGQTKSPAPAPPHTPPAAQAEKAEKKPAESTPATPAKEPETGTRFDMKEVPPIVTHHQIAVNGKALRYTATAGRLPIPDANGKTQAEMFFVAYTLDGAEPGSRPLTFAFNGGPGSATVWLHIGALGPKKVILQKEGWLPAAPYRLEDNPDTCLDRADLVFVDAIGTGFSRPADAEQGKKFWSVNGDIAAFGEFIRLYITRYERWSSPLFLFGESYGTTRAAGVAGYLAGRGITFNGVVLLSSILNFETVQFRKGNDLPYVLTLPSYTMIAAYHKKLAPDLMKDLARTREQVEQWASNEYARALAKGDSLTPEERRGIIEQLARYTGLKPEIVDQANLRIDVNTFTHNLLADQKLYVGRLDGRYTGPGPAGFLESRGYDPTLAATRSPFTAVFNDYVRRELGYKTDMPYYVLGEGENIHWDWGSAGAGFPNTATALREAIVQDPY